MTYFRARPWLAAAGMAMLYLLPPLAEFLSPLRHDYYHQLLPFVTLDRGLLIDLVVLTLLFAGPLVAAGRATSVRRDWLWLPVLCVLGWIVMRDIAGWITAPAIRSLLLRSTPYAPVLVLGIALLLLRRAPRVYRLAIRASAVLLASAGIAALFVVLPRLAFACFGSMPREQPSFSHSVEHPWRPGEMRIVWLLFDELSQKQIASPRPSAVALPAFDQLAKESISYTELTPAGYQTAHVIPALFLGEPVSEIRGDHEGRLLLRAEPGDPWRAFREDATVFAVAKRAGWSTGVAGWYNPYCRILKDTLDRCYWTFSGFQAGQLFEHLSSDRSSLENARDSLPFVTRLETLLHPLPPHQSHRDDYDNLMREAKSLIADDRIRFVFLHLPIPHPPGIDPRRDAAGRLVEDYLGNLMLADRTLAQLRSDVTRTRAAADTVLIVSSDHSWRLPMWRNAGGWTSEEERATQGIFDPRPVLMVHFPGQTSPAEIDRPQSALLLHGLLLGLLDGRIRSAENVLSMEARLPAGKK